VLGNLVAVLAELPVILGFAWAICRWQLRSAAVGDRFDTRLAMGVVALSLLFAAEFTLAVRGFGMMPAEFLARYQELPRALGLAGQLLFGLFPLIAPAGTGADPPASRSA
jgi:hypothetical protein